MQSYMSYWVPYNGLALRLRRFKESLNGRWKQSPRRSREKYETIQKKYEHIILIIYISYIKLN